MKLKDRILLSVPLFVFMLLFLILCKITDIWIGIN